MKNNPHTVAFSFNSLTISTILINLKENADIILTISMIIKLICHWKDNSLEIKLNPITNKIKRKSVKINR